MNIRVRLIPVYLLVSLLMLTGCSLTRQTLSPTDPTEEFRRQVDAILADSAFIPVVTTMKIVSLTNSDVLYERNSKLLMHPASNMKLLTSAASLLRLGRTYAFTTRFLCDGTVADSVLHGNLYIVGSGDPDFSSAFLSPLASELQQKGIARIDGDIVGDASKFDGERWGVGWMWDDEPSSDEAYNSALSINRNCVTVTAAPGDSAGAAPRVAIDPPTLYMSVENSAVTGAPLSPNTLEISRRCVERTNIITVKGSLPAGAHAKTESISVQGPEQYFLTLALEELQRQHIMVSGTTRLGTAPAGARELARHEQPIDSMVVFMNKVSDNLSAENSIKVLSAETLGREGSTQHGISLVKQTLAGFGIDSTAFLMVDGSGVSHYNLLTSEIYIRLLQGMAKHAELFPLYYASLPVAGVDGTLAKRMRNTPAQRNLHAKTGTISGVTTLAGYVTTADGEMLAFSMMMQNFIGSSERYRRAQDAIGALMASLRRHAQP